MIALEGWDTAGKGGLIRRLSTRLDPRHCRVWPIGPPTPDEQGRHYLYRFWRKPAAAELGDLRSHLVRPGAGRAGRGPRRQARLGRAYDEINEFEADAGRGRRAPGQAVPAHLAGGAAGALFASASRVPYKRWKLTADELRNRRHWAAYEHAIDDMFERTSTKAAPWHGVPCEFKWYGRVECLKIICRELSRDVDLDVAAGRPEDRQGDRGAGRGASA